MVAQETVVGYVRVSTNNQVTNGEGLQIQRRKIQDYCKEKGVVLERFYEDKGISGAVRDRPALLRLLKDCETRHVRKIIVYKQDRLSRELTVALWLETQFKKYDIDLISIVDPDYDMEDPLQKAFKRIADVFAELEKDVIAMRLREGRINNAKNGERGSGAIPFGYKKVEDKLDVNPEEAQWVEKIFRWRARGFGYTKIMKELNKCGVKTKRNGPFNLEGVKYVINSPVYYGAAIYGDIHAKGTHPAIISKRLYVSVQNVLRRNKESKDFS